jgi:hypothetical protein
VSDIAFLLPVHFDVSWMRPSYNEALTACRHSRKELDYYPQTTYAPSLSVHRVLLIPRKFLQLLVVNALQLRAAQATDDVADGTCEAIERTKQDIRLSLRSKLVEKARKIV